MEVKTTVRLVSFNTRPCTNARDGDTKLIAVAQGLRRLRVINETQDVLAFNLHVCSSSRGGSRTAFLLDEERSRSFISLNRPAGTAQPTRPASFAASVGGERAVCPSAADSGSESNSRGLISGGDEGEREVERRQTQLLPRVTCGRTLRHTPPNFLGMMGYREGVTVIMALQALDFTTTSLTTVW